MINNDKLDEEFYLHSSCLLQIVVASRSYFIYKNIFINTSENVIFSLKLMYDAGVLFK